MDAALRLSKLIDSLNRVIARAMGWALFLMVLVGAYNAIARSLEKELGLSLSSNAYIEAQWYLFSLVFLLGAPYALRSNAHVRVDVLYGEHPARGKAWTDLIGGVLFLIPFCLFAIWISWDFVSNSIAVGELSPDPGGLPRWPLKLVVPISFALLCLQGASEVVKRAAFLCGRSADEIGLEEPSLVDRSTGGES
ncbi:MAG: TRAP transporter small permease subunit [Planctomycetes bacterium]|nr:TRAP transporter small permease subunit [Planctomycetota bacterium]